MDGPTSLDDYKNLMSELIKKQIIILGPDISLAKARAVSGLKVADDGSITEIVGDPKVILGQLIDEFVSLSGLIVKKTMEPLLSSYPGLAGIVKPVVPEQ